MKLRPSLVLLCLAAACGAKDSRPPAPAARPAAAPPPRAPETAPTGARDLIDRLMRLGHQAVPMVPFGPDFRKPLEAPRLVARRDTGELELALAHTSVTARVTGNVARVEVRQLYQNPTADRLEAVYLFPLPENAAVNDMMFRIGDRVVMSEVKERVEARQVYEAAKREGHTAALTEQERPNLFTQSVANIPPGQSVEVVLRYVQEIPFDQGRYRFVFPTTVGPRYTNAATKDADRVTAPVVPEGERSAHDLEIAVELSPAAAFADVAASSHEIVTAVDGETRLLTLGPGDRIPNKDFVLHWRPAGREPDARAVLGKDRDGDYLMLFVQPPVEVAPAQVRPRQVVFLVDKSGSMMGEPIELAKQVITRSLASMGPEDTFQIVAFDSGVTLMSERPLPPEPENLAEAKRWLGALGGYGGTEMLVGIKTALDLPADPKRLKMVVFLTDGFIGNEPQIIEHVGKAVEDGTRVFGFGIGSSVNRYLIEGVARAGRGAAEVVTLHDPVDQAVARMFRRLDRPVLTDLEVRFTGLEVTDREPEKLPDLFAGQPLVVLGKVRGQGPAEVSLRGRLGVQPFERRFAVTVDEAAGQKVGELLGTLWARRRIETLSHRQPYAGPTEEEKKQIIALALRRKLITAYTSFVAVERQLKVDTNVPLTKLLVPNELPEGVSAAGIFGTASSVGVVPARVKPGDPEVRVEAAWAEAVLVTLPFGGPRLAAVPDPARGDWVARFLVPPAWPDGSFDATVDVVWPGGRHERRTAPIRVDTDAPALVVVGAPAEVRAGSEVVVEVKQALALSRLGELLDGRRAGGRLQALKGAIDVKDVWVRAPWGEVVAAKAEGPLGVFTARLHAPPDLAPGTLTFELVAIDTAGNVGRRDLVVRGAARPVARAGLGLLLLLGVVLCGWALRRRGR